MSASLASAAPSKAVSPTDSYLLKAAQELAPPSGSPPALTSATVAIREDILAREDNTSRWALGIFVQNFEPGGVGSRRGVGDYPLESLKPATMLRLEGRWHLNPLVTSLGTWLPQVMVQGSYSRQDVDLTTATGFQYQDTRLTTLLTGVGYRLGVRPWRARAIELAAGVSAGQALNFQTSRSDSATFSKNEWYGAGVLSARTYFAGQWSLEVQYENRTSLASQSLVRVQDHNLLVGMNWGRNQ